MSAMPGGNILVSHVTSQFLTVIIICLMKKITRFTQPASSDRYFLWKLVTVILMQTVWLDSFTWPLVVFLFSCCVYPLASSCAHTFSTMSVRARHICFFFDYAALSFYSLGEWNWPGVRGWKNTVPTTLTNHPVKINLVWGLYQE